MTSEGPSIEGLGPHSDAEGDFDRHASMFPDGAPSVGIGGIQISRSTLTNVQRAEKDSKVSWHVSGFPLPGFSDRMSVMGDLSVADESWFAGVTVIAHLAFKEPLDRDPSANADELNHLASIYGPWASDLLYDVAATWARTLIGSNLACKLVVPVLTPKPHLGVVSFGKEDVGAGAATEAH